MKGARYAAQFFALPEAGGMMSRATLGMKRELSSAALTQAGSRRLRSATASP